MNEKLTPDELGYLLWANYPEDQRVANLLWLENVFKTLTIGGVWFFISEARAFKKVDEDHFLEVD